MTTALILATLAVGYGLGRWRQYRIEQRHWRAYQDTMAGKRSLVSTKFRELV